MVLVLKRIFQARIIIFIYFNRPDWTNNEVPINDSNVPTTTTKTTKIYPTNSSHRKHMREIQRLKIAIIIFIPTI